MARPSTSSLLAFLSSTPHLLLTRASKSLRPFLPPCPPLPTLVTPPTPIPRLLLPPSPHPSFASPQLRLLTRHPSPFSLPPCHSFHPRSFASRPVDVTVSANSSPAHGSSIPAGGVQGGEGHTNEIGDMSHNALNAVVETATAMASWAKEKTADIIPLIREWLDPSCYIGEPVNQAVTQLGLTASAAALTWFVMPRLFRRLHRYVEQGPTARLLKRTAQEQVPYELSIWSALEDPARMLTTVIVFTQLGALVAPTTVATQYIGQVWRGAAVVTLVWFLHRWKSNVLSRVLAGRAMEGVERERYLALDKISSVGLFVLGGMALAETCGVAVQSILTVGGIGGVATAFAARDVLGNMLSGFSLQFSKPFSIGETISAGPIEGQVVDIGLTSTYLLNADKFPIVVPNSFFSNQVIVNKSRVQLRVLAVKLPLQLKDFDKVPQITQCIKEMLNSHPKVYCDSEAPRCFISRVGTSSMDVTVSCNLKPMGKDELLSTQQDIILKAVRILSESGATLGVPG